MLKLNKVYKYYNKGKANEIKAVDGISLELGEKGLTVILGKSGCGKSTLLNTLSGLDSQSSGEIIYNDQTFDKYNSKQWDELRNEKIGYIFQNYNLLENMTVYQNLEIALKLAGITQDVKQRIEYALELVGMKKYARRLPRTLSGGQQQRVGIARAIVKGPSVLFADEPTGNLDDTNTIAVMEILKGLSMHCLVVMVTHEEQLADFYADRIIRITDGKIVSDEINNKDVGLDHKASDVIYLGDLQSKQVSQNGIDFNIFCDDKPISAEVKVVSYDGKLFIQVNSQSVVNIINETSSISFNEGKYAVKEKKDIHLDINTDLLACKERKKLSPFNYKHTVKSVFDNFLKSSGQRKRNMFRTLYLSAVFLVLLISVISGDFVFDPFSQNCHDSHVVVVDATAEELSERTDGTVLSNSLYSSVYASLEYSPFPVELYFGSVNDLNVLPASVIGKDYSSGTAAIDKRIFDRMSKAGVLDEFGIVFPKQLVGMRLFVDNYGYMKDFPMAASDDGAIVRPTKFDSVHLVDPGDIPDIYIAEVIDRGEPVIYLADEDYAVLSSTDSLEYIYKQGKTLYYAQDPTAFIKEYKKKGIEVNSVNQNKQKEYYLSALQSNVISMLLIAIVLFIQVFALVKYFRSRFISESKKYAILRSLGVRKKDMLSNCLIESGVSFFVTSFRGWLIASIVVIIMDNLYMLKTMERYLGIQVVYYPIWIMFALFAFLLLLSVLISLILPLLFMRKTPSALLTKYDL